MSKFSSEELENIKRNTKSYSHRIDSPGKILTYDESICNFCLMKKFIYDTSGK